MTTAQVNLVVDLPIASDSQVGGVSIQSDSGLLVDSSGNLSVDDTQFLSVSNAESTYVTESSLDSYALLASPALTGIPTAPTATSGTNTTQLATTAFVAAAVATVSGSNGVQFNNSVETFTISTSSGGSVTIPDDVYLIVVNGPPGVSGTNPTFGSFTVNMPTPAGDGHTFEIVAGGVTGVGYTVPGGSGTSVQTFGGSTSYGTISGDSGSVYYVGYGYSMKFTYIEATNTWYGRS